MRTEVFGKVKTSRHFEASHVYVIKNKKWLRKVCLNVYESGVASEQWSANLSCLEDEQ